MPQPKTLFDKVWERRQVRAESADAPAMLYVDLHLVHEVTSPQAFAELDARGRKVRRPDRMGAAQRDGGNGSRDAGSDRHRIAPPPRLAGRSRPASKLLPFT